MDEGLRLLLVGATGAVGREVLRLALSDAGVRKVVAPTRRPLPAHAKLENPVTADFATLPDDAPCWRVDAVICTLGTTLRAAGSQAAFAAIDRDLPVSVARRARAGGATRFALNSSVGANPTGNFYLRTKAQAEAGVRTLGYDSVTIVRPSIIDVSRTEARPAEALALLLARLLRPLIPRRYRAVTPAAIAHALLRGVLTGTPGERIIESDRLQA